MYPFGWHGRSDGRRTRQVLLIALAVLLVLNIVQFFVFRPTANRDARFRDAIASRLRANVASAENMANQLSRSGGSSTQKLLSETRQYLYAAGQCSELAQTVLGGAAMIAPKLTDDALKAVDACISKILAAQPIDTPLAELGDAIKAVSAAAAQI